ISETSPTGGVTSVSVGWPSQPHLRCWSLLGHFRESDCAPSVKAQPAPRGKPNRPPYLANRRDQLDIPRMSPDALASLADRPDREPQARAGQASLYNPDASSNARIITNSEPITTPDSRTFDSATQDRKSTRLNSSHRTISYAVFC